MNTALLIRDETSEHGTLGRLRAGELRLHVIEPPWRDNRRGLSCIPAGRYQVLPHISPRYGRTLLVSGVTGRSHILIHAGNVGGDKTLGFKTHTLGCLLPGLKRGRLKIAGRRQHAVLASRPAVRQVMAWSAGAPFDLEIHDA